MSVFDMLWQSLCFNINRNNVRVHNVSKPTIHDDLYRGRPLLKSKLVVVLVFALSMFTSMKALSVQTVSNNAVQLVFDEIWRLSDSDPEYLIGIPTDASAVGGNVLILDKLLKTVHIFDQLGKYQGQIGRPGDGPGEFHNPVQVVGFSDDTVGILTYVPGYIHHFLMDGELIASHKIDTGAIKTVGHSIYGLDPLFVLLISDMTTIVKDGNRGTSSLTKFVQYSYEGDISTEYHAKKRDLIYMGNKLPPPIETEQYFMSGFDASRSYVYLATESNEYKIAVLNSASDTVKVITRDYQSRKRTKTERDSIELARSMPSGECVRVNYQASDLEQDIIDLKVSEDDRLWVLNSNGANDQPSGVYQVWDRFDEFGVFDDQVEIVLDVNNDDVVFWLDEETVLLCRNLKSTEESYYAVSQGREIENPEKENNLELIYLQGRYVEKSQ